MDEQQELRNLLMDIEMQISEIRGQASQMGISPYKLRLSDGSWVMIPLLSSKALVLNGLAVLKARQT